jgi:hypothetical protein
MLILNNIIANEKNILHQCVTTQPGRKTLKTFNYGKTTPRVV